MKTTSIAKISDQSGPIRYGAFYASGISPKPPHKRLEWRMDYGIVSHPCGICGEGYAALVTRPFENGDYLVAYYKCGVCEEEYTTNEIDEINLAPMMVDKRKRKRINIMVKMISSLLNIKQNKWQNK